jgi:hypothetical protein
MTRLEEIATVAGLALFTASAFILLIGFGG